MNLRVLARGSIVVLDPAFAQATGHRRYVGRSTVTAWQPSELPAGEPCHIQHNSFLEPGDKAIPHTAYPKSGVAEEVPCDRYFMRALKNGELWAADRPTAEIADVPYDPTFGGEYPNLSKPVKGAKAGD